MRVRWLAGVGLLLVSCQVHKDHLAASEQSIVSTPAWTAESDQAGGEFGRTVASAGDVNGDGYDDVVVGAWRYDNGQTDEGRALLYLGSATGLATTAAWTAESDQAGAYFGVSVASAGDVNGDGYADVLVGATSYDNGQADEGRAFLYLGSATGLQATAAWTAESNQTNAIFGYPAVSAGDVNGDGYADVVIGAHDYDNVTSAEGRAFLYLGSATGLQATAAWAASGDQPGDYFGSVASAGDVNADGYGDVVVGAYGYDNGQFNEGRALLYLGSATALSPTAAWTAESDQASAYFGLGSVASAGDVNGDGYGDVVVGAWRYTNGESIEGRAFLYLGTATGLTATAAWTAESDQVAAEFGRSVASAGDVNGDGYGDIVVGACLHENGQTDEGRAFLYLGSATGLAATAEWTAESDQTQAILGISVASAGDVNGDGFGDVVVGAIGYDNGETEEGRAFLYLGSAIGDADGDAIPDTTDNCPLVANPTQDDFDADGLGDACDPVAPDDAGPDDAAAADAGPDAGAGALDASAAVDGAGGRDAASEPPAGHPDCSCRVGRTSKPPLAGMLPFAVLLASLSIWNTRRYRRPRPRCRADYSE